MKWRGVSHRFAFVIEMGFLHVSSLLQAGDVSLEFVAVVGPGEPESYGLIMGAVFLMFAIWKLGRRLIAKARSTRSNSASDHVKQA
jgi:hypothetical protein